MYRPMCEIDHDICVQMACFAPYKIGLLSPGQFAERFGIPSPDQWDSLREVLKFDVMGRIRPILPLGYRFVA